PVGWFLESRTAGATLDRLRRLSRFGDFFHFGGDEFWIAAFAREQGFGEDVIVRRAAMTIGVMHVRVAYDMQAAAPIDRADLDKHVLGLTPVGTAVHAQRAADRAGNPAHERQTANAGFRCRARDLPVRDSGTGANPRAFDGGAIKPAPEPDDRAPDPAIAHNQIRTKSDHRHGELIR